jgi:hypothetical protein
MAGPLVTSVVVAALPLLGDVHVDGDTAGRGVLAWTGLRGDAFVAQAAPVAAGRRIGRKRNLWRTRGNVAVDDVDVAPSGTAAVCLRERPNRRSDAWRVRVVQRSATGAWSRPRLVAAPGRFVQDISCAVDDAGDVVLAWAESVGPPERLRATAVTATGSVAPVVTLGARPEPSDVRMAPDGTAVVAFAAAEPGRRHLWVAEHSAADAWSPVAPVPPPAGEEAQGPKLALDGAGRRLLAWNADAPPTDAIRLATGTTTSLAPTTVRTGDVALASLTAGVRGDVLLTFETHPVRGNTGLSAMVQRPGAPFAPAVTLGPLGSFPIATGLAPDGTGLVAWGAGTRRRPQLVVRALGSDGRWSASRALTRTGQQFGTEVGIAPATGRRSTIAWTTEPFGNGVVRLRLAAM